MWLIPLSSELHSHVWHCGAGAVLAILLAKTCKNFFTKFKLSVSIFFDVNNEPVETHARIAIENFNWKSGRGRMTEIYERGGWWCVIYRPSRSFRRPGPNKLQMPPSRCRERFTYFTHRPLNLVALNIYSIRLAFNSCHDYHNSLVFESNFTT